MLRYDDPFADAPAWQGGGGPGGGPGGGFTHPSGKAGPILPAERSLPGLHDEERLPWLEAGDDLHDAGVDSARVWAVVLAGLALLIAIGGVWWMHRTDNGSQLADGGMIAAPPGAIKEAPRDPGGKTFDGTGDSSFAVSQGHSPDQTLASRNDDADIGDGANGPGEVATQTAGAAGIGTQSDHGAGADHAPNLAGVIGVQLGAFSTELAAQTAWDRLAKTYDALSGAGHRIVAGKADIGTVYRLQAVAGSDGAATALCARLKTAGLNCQVQD